MRSLFQYNPLVKLFIVQNNLLEGLLNKETSICYALKKYLKNYGSELRFIIWELFFVFIMAQRRNKGGDHSRLYFLDSSSFVSS